jgi:ABC-type Fe3+-hydroxamate transport system substrate-binding protein
MKARSLFLGIFILFSAVACVTTQSSSILSSKSSTEMEARRVTSEMKTVLNLDNTQEEKVLLINVVNFAILKKLQDNNQTQEIVTTKEKYKNEIKQVLSSNQYSKFLEKYGNI